MKILRDEVQERWSQAQQKVIEAAEQEVCKLGLTRAKSKDLLAATVSNAKASVELEGLMVQQLVKSVEMLAQKLAATRKRTTKKKED